jgi:membrane-bound serine protease (ClpP class)
MLKNRASLLLALIIAMLFYLGVLPGNKDTYANEKKVYYAILKGTVDKKMASDVKAIIDEAEKSNAEALILEIDTFGGRLDAAVEIKDRLIDTNLITIAFINKKAISAGALISLAAQHIVMAPGSTIGAATPVRLTYWEEKPASEKVISYFRKEMKTTAEANHHPGDIAEAMVDPDVVIANVVEKGKLLTLTTTEALRLKVAEHEIKKQDDLLNVFNLQGTILEKRSIPWTEKIVKLVPDKNILSNPTLLWFLVGLVLAFLEFAVPGVILIFFGVAAWIVAFTVYIGLTSSIESQLLTFIAASILLLISLRRWVKGKFHGHVRDVQDPSQNLDEFTGKDVLVLKDVIPRKTGGYVEFKGASWSAVSEEPLKKGGLAIITGLDGITLKIKKKEG